MGLSVEVSPISIDRISKKQIHVTLLKPQKSQNKLWLQELLEYTPQSKYTFDVVFKRVWKYLADDSGVVFQLQINRVGNIFYTSSGHFIHVDFENINLIEREEAIAMLLERKQMLPADHYLIQSLQEIGNIRRDLKDLSDSLTDLSFHSQEIFRHNRPFLSTGAEDETFYDEFMLLLTVVKRFEMTLDHAERLLFDASTESDP